jgi:hypothetical protein
MAKCWLNTWTRSTGMGIGNPDSFHVAACAWCEAPRDYLIQALTEFKDWSRISSYIEEGEPLRLEIEQWQTLPVEEQQRLVQKAQGYRLNEIEIPEVKDWWNQESG